MRKTYITSESVTEGHPDKICDQISDAILDDLIKQDPNSRVAVECLAKSGMIMVAGEVRTEGYTEIQRVARETLEDIGYTNPEFGIDHEDAAVLVSISEQSPEIAQGVDESSSHEQGAGDQGLMYGYACKDTKELMPLPIMLAHKLTKKLAEVRKNDVIEGLGPDGKSQVSVEYVDGKPERVTAVVIAQQHLKSVTEKKLKKQIKKKVIEPVCGDWIDEETKFHINATGKFVIGGPEADAGITGRKIVVDTYGGVGRVGGGAFSGKDPSKVDRSAAYMARHIAKNVVSAGLADECEVQLSYSIGVAEPTSVNVDTFGTNKVPEQDINDAIEQVFDLKPSAIIKYLDLKNPIFKKTACYGHFGREEFSWEKTNKANILKKKSGL